MTRKGAILTLYFASWPVNSFQRLWNNSPAKIVYWYFANRKCGEDIQWYVHDVCQSISYLLIFLAGWMYLNSNYKRDKDVRIAFGAILVNQCIDIVHYIGWHRRCEEILLLEGIIIVIAALKIFLKNRKPN